MSGDVQTDYQGVPLSGYLATPAGTPRAGLIVIQEWWGLNDDIRSIADRYAAAGYLAFAPDLYHGAVATEPDEAQKMAMSLERDLAAREIDAAIGWLKTEHGVAKVGCTGFCMGGALSLATAARPTSPVDAVHAYYGTPPTEGEVQAVRVPVMGSYGGDDAYIPADGIRAMEETLRANGVPTDIKIYPGAGHSFFNAGPAHHAPSAADSWERSLRWWEQHLS